MLAETQLHFLWTEWNAANLLAFLIVCGGYGEIGAVGVAHMVTRRDGGPDTCVRIDLTLRPW